MLKSLLLPAALMFAGRDMLRPTICADDGLVCDWRRKTGLPASLSAHFADLPAATLIARPDLAGFGNETGPGDAQFHVRTRTGGLCNDIVGVPICQDGLGHIERSMMNQMRPGRRPAPAPEENASPPRGLFATGTLHMASAPKHALPDGTPAA